MSNVTFLINGLAVFYRKEESESWTVVFPTDDCHTAKLFITRKETGISEPIADLARAESVKFISTSSIPPKEGIYEDPSFTREVMDLTSVDFFQEGVKKNPNPPNTIGEKRLEIKHALLMSEELRENRLNYVFPVDNPGAIKLLKDEDGKPKLFSKLIGGSIALEENGKITIEINGSPIELLAGDHFEIDNDCKLELSEENDFQMYQHLYLSKDVDSFNQKLPNGKFRRFEAISIFQPRLEDSSEDPTIKGITKPPPRVCDSIRIGKPKNLD